MKYDGFEKLEVGKGVFYINNPTDMKYVELFYDDKYKETIRTFEYNLHGITEASDFKKEFERCQRAMIYFRNGVRK